MYFKKSTLERADICDLEKYAVEEIAAMSNISEKIQSIEISESLADTQTANHEYPAAGQPNSGLLSVGPTYRISIRVPVHIILAAKRESARQGVPYQTLMNNALAVAARSW